LRWFWHPFSPGVPFFDNFDYHFDVNDDSDPFTIAEVLKEEVIEFYSSSCWDQTEMEINDLNPMERAKLKFQDVVEWLYGCCVEC
jgi:hypothetical protein